MKKTTRRTAKKETVSDEYICYIRPSGTEITLKNNDANKAYAKANGWKVK